MGDGVNIAARLEGINKEFSTSICISHATYKEAGERLWTRPVDIITVKGRKGEIPIYEVLAIRGDDPETMATDRDKALCALTREAFLLFSKKQYREAADCPSWIPTTVYPAYQSLSKVAANSRPHLRTTV
jgi:adenylate cyclase